MRWGLSIPTRTWPLRLNTLPTPETGSVEFLLDVRIAIAAPERSNRSWMGDNCKAGADGD